MTYFAIKRIWMLTVTVAACSACVSTGGSAVGMAGGVTSSPTPTSGSAGLYGDEFSVQATIGAIKLRGNQDRMSSRAIRLPERPLGEIAVFGYQFPLSCGGHEFRVYETQDTQILEYQFDSNDGGSQMIRDYISGPSPFVKPGLWSAYDHTADSISTMTSQFEQRTGKSMHGVYSQGLVTGLPAVEQRELGNAYQQALSDVYDCRGTPAVADASTQ
jgi:hypothetical protein